MLLKYESEDAIEWTDNSSPIILFSDDDLLVLFKGFVIESSDMRFNIYVENNSNETVQIELSNSLLNNASVRTPNSMRLSITPNSRYSTLSQYVWLFQVYDLRDIYGDDYLNTISLRIKVRKGESIVLDGTSPLKLKTRIKL